MSQRGTINRTARAEICGSDAANTTLSTLRDAIAPGHCRRWQLQDAKSQFSEVVQRALEGSPQCVTKHGKDAVIIISYDALVSAVRLQQNLFDFFRSSPLVDAGLDFDRMPGTVREAEL